MLQLDLTSCLQAAGAIVSNDVLLYRTSYFLPEGKLNRYYLLRLDEKKIQVTESTLYKKIVQIKYENGDWGEWEIDYQGYYCVEHVIFCARIEFCVYSDGSDIDYFYFNGRSYELDKITLSCDNKLLTDTFSVRYQEK